MANRLLHTMIRVRDLERSIAFYTEQLGMQVLRRKDYPAGRFTLAFLGFGPEDAHTAIELTHNWDQAEPYTIGSGFGHLAVGVDDVTATCDRMRTAGVRIAREPGPMKHGTTVIAFVEDPDGYRVELIQR